MLICVRKGTAVTQYELVSIEVSEEDGVAFFCRGLTGEGWVTIRPPRVVRSTRVTGFVDFITGLTLKEGEVGR